MIKQAVFLIGQTQTIGDRNQRTEQMRTGNMISLLGMLAAGSGTERISAIDHAAKRNDEVRKKPLIRK